MSVLDSSAIIHVYSAISVDFTSLLLGLLAGSSVVGLSLYFGAIRKRRGREVGKYAAEVRTTDSLTGKLITKADIDAARRELRLLKMEKEYLSSALARIYEAEARGLINKEERVALSQKYRIQLKEIEEKIARAQTIVDVSDLEDARAELLNLVNQKISQIDSRLEELRQRLSPLMPPVEKLIQQEQPAPEIKEKKEKEEVVKKPEIMDDKLKKVVQDVNEVMAKLEQMDLEE